MYPAINPYESPREITEPPLPPDEHELRRRVYARLVVPAMAFIILGGGQAAALFLVGVQFFASGSPRSQWDEPAQVWQTALWVGLGSLDLLIAIAGYRLLQLRSSQLAFAAAIFCSIPGFSPLCIVGIPFGLWTLGVLMLPSTNQAFDEEEQRRHAKGEA